MAEPEMITDDRGVDALAESARGAGAMALDLEFLWERTYAPKACLAQVAVGERISLVDPIEGASLAPLAELLEDPDVEVVMHAPSADLQLLSMAFGVRPRNMADVQIAAGFVGLGAGQSLASLLSRVLSVRLDKGERYTDWSRRPLSDAQLSYAAADVEHLFPLRDALMRRAEDLGRRSWVEEEVERRYGADARLAPDPERSWQRVKGQGRLSPRERARLKAAAEWRERTAARRNIPVGWVLPDRPLVQAAQRRPKNRDALMRERGVPDRFSAKDADALLQALAAGDEAEPIRMPPAPPPEVQDRLETLVPLGAVLVGGRAAAAEVASTLVGTRDDITAFLAAALGADREPGPLGEGWRATLVGDALTDLAEGRLALAATPEPPYLLECVPGRTDAAGAPAAGVSAEGSGGNSAPGGASPG